MPEVSGSSDALLKLSVRMDPGEAARLARMTGAELKRELGGVLDELSAAHKRAAEAMTSQAQKQAKDEITAYRNRTRDLTAGLKEIEREQARVTRGMSTNWRRTMEDLENITTVARGVFDVIRGGAARFAQLADEIIKVTNVYRSLTGSIEQAADATDGTVENIDLIIAKNASMSAGLNLSNSQFAEVAKAADSYGDAVGISAKEALDPFIASLAAGNERMLKRIGVLVDAQAVEKRYAAIVEQSVESLTEQQKRAAFVDEAMKQIISHNKELNAQPTTFADSMEKAMVGVKNTFNEFKAGVGGLKVPAEFERFVGVFGRLYSAMSADNSGHGPVAAAIRAFEGVSHNLDTGDAAMARIAQQGADFNRKLSPDEESDAATKFLEGGKRRKPEKLKEPNIVYASPDTITGLDRLFYKAAVEEQNRLAKLSDEAYDSALEAMRDEQKKRGETSLVGFAGGYLTKGQRDDFTAAQGKAAASQSRWGEQNGALVGDKYERGTSTGLTSLSLAQARTMPVDEDFLKDLEAKVAESREKAGGGLLGQLLFGDDTTMEQTYDRMDEFKKRSIDTVGELNDFFRAAAQTTTDALGHAVGAYLSEGAAAGVSAKKVLHELTKGLAEQSAAKALWEGVQAAADAIGGNFIGAGQHLAKAAIYGGFAVTMGAASRATYSAPSGAGSTPTSVRGSSSGASSGGGSRSGGDTSPVNLQLNVMFGDEDSIARGLRKLADNYKRKTNRDLFDVN